VITENHLLNTNNSYIFLHKEIDFLI